MWELVTCWQLNYESRMTFSYYHINTCKFDWVIAIFMFAKVSNSLQKCSLTVNKTVVTPYSRWIIILCTHAHCKHLNKSQELSHICLNLHRIQIWRLSKACFSLSSHSGFPASMASCMKHTVWMMVNMTSWGEHAHWQKYGR